MLLTEVPHPQFVELLKASDAELMQRPIADLMEILSQAETFQEEGMWSDEMMDYIKDQGEDNYVYLHWAAEKHYADLLKSNLPQAEQDYYYLVGYARIVALVLRYHDNMGYDKNDFYFVRGFLRHTFPDDKAIKILEIGAGSGKLLADLGREGYRDVEGMEMAPAALREARDNVRDVLGEQVVHPVSFQDYRLLYPDRQYDVIIHAHLIEHIPAADTSSFLEACYESLRPGGYMIVITPSRLTGPHDVTRYFRPGGSEPEGFHLKEYTLTDLEATLRKAGFGEFATVRSLPSLNYWWNSIPTEADFTYKRNLEAFLMSMAWEQRKPIVDGMYYVGMVCRRL
jgi:2-polyprenyl-3-methyl-5-hydroxy-6-metoxy-1,4-benzoquinol methylase